MMDGTCRPPSSDGGDRLSKLQDRVLGHVLSFLPANEAARAALLSSRWRDVFAAVHTVSLEEPDQDSLTDSDDCYDDDSRNSSPVPNPRPGAPPRFPCAVSNALLTRGAAPLRALRVDMENHDGARSSTVDQWVTYAVKQGAPEGLRLDLRLRRVPLCRPYSLLQRSGCQNPDAGEEDRRSMSPTNMTESPPRASRRRRRPYSDIRYESSEDDEEPHPRRRRSVSSNEDRRSISINGRSSSDSDDAGDRAPSPWKRSATSSRRSSCDRSPSPSSCSSDDDVFLRSPLSSSSEDDDLPSPRENDEEAARLNCLLRKGERTVPALLFSCAVLRSLSLSLGHFRLAPPTKVNLPSLETMLLSHVSGSGSCVERIIAGSPRLADLTLEACCGVVSLYVPSGARLRRLALRCCHNLATVEVDTSELVAFEYRGAAMPNDTFLIMHGSSPKVAYCKIDICGQEISSEEEVTKLAQLVQLFANIKRLHLESAHLGSGIDKDVLMNFPTLSCLRHLELRGRLPDDDTAVVGAMSRILGQTPNLQALSLFFHPEPLDWDGYNEEEQLDAHRLKYNAQSVHFAEPSSMIRCLRSSVREINLVHYQGGRAQRALAKFLLGNAPVIETLWCEVAEGPLWTQTQLMREIRGWVVNKSANTHFL